MALYEWQDGKIGNVCVQGGEHPICCLLLKGMLCAPGSSHVV